MKEAKEKVVIMEAESEIVRELLRFMYTGKVENMAGIYFQLFQLAHTYLVAELQRMCQTFMIRNTNVENALETYFFGKKYDLPLVSEKAKKIIFR